MTKRKRHILEDFKKEISSLSLDELHDLRIKLSRDYNKHIEEGHIIRARIDTIGAMMAEKRGAGDFGISDHAVLRYLERYKGLDVASVRTQIRELIGQKTFRTKHPDHHFIGNGLVAVIPGGSIVATIYADDDTSDDTSQEALR